VRPKTEIQTFVSDWVAKNVPSHSGPANLACEVDRLAARLTFDARTLGISGGEINLAVGDIDDYLTEQFRLQAGATPA